MTVNLNPADDFELFDGRATVSYVSTSGESTDTTITGLSAIHRAANHRDAQQLAGLGISGVERVFHISASGLTSVSPKEGDKIVDASGVKWRVLRAAFQTLGTRWRCDCKRTEV